MKKDKKKFEEIFRANIGENTSQWDTRPAAMRDDRSAFRRSQRVADRILEFLDENKDWNQKRLAEALGVSTQYVSKFLKGRENFTLNTIEQIERVLNINLLAENQIQVVVPKTIQSIPVYLTDKRMGDNNIIYNSTVHVMLHSNEHDQLFYTGQTNFCELLLDSTKNNTKQAFCG